MFKPQDFFDMQHCPFPEFYDGIENVWEGIGKISGFIGSRIQPGVDPTARISSHAFIGDDVQVGANTVVMHGAVILGPAIIGSNCEIRTGAFLRPDVIVGSGSVLGNSCEFKNCFIHNEGEVPHFAYVGDSMLGFKAHLGAGVKISNVKLTWETVKIKGEHGVIDTGMLKLGAILGDNTDIGCNSVLNPGSLIGKKSIIYPGSSWRGVLPAGRIVKKRETFEVVERRQS
jgi:UDP-N-acetylglucosamine diphosphorylase / glucose-1-phosphate thymidylyltransferase / UDP-N-acetylgalactosamine diphosphorylase / glucosamine-1-phosphate N-acetyltransferase / galactosamine-1-phosphate N-acetyltransferase